MRFLVNVQIPTETGNSFVKDPSFIEKLQTVFADQKAESIYFGVRDGVRSISYVTDIHDGSKLPSIAEPWWLMAKARIETTPVFTPQEMQKAGAEIAALTKKWG